MKYYFEQAVQFLDQEFFDKYSGSRDMGCCKCCRATSVRIILLGARKSAWDSGSVYLIRCKMLLWRKARLVCDSMVRHA